MEIKFLITIIITSAISSVITAFFMKKYYYSYVEKMFVRLDETVKKVYGNDKRFWEADEDYKRKADTLIISAKEFVKTYNCIEHKLSETKTEVSNLEMKVELKKNGMKYMERIKGLLNKSFFQFLKNIMNNYFFVL